MEEEKKLSLDDFMDLFVTVSYLQEQRFFNLGVLKSFTELAFNLNKEESLILSSELDRIMEEMVEKNYIDRVPGFEYLVNVNETVPFMQIISQNFKYLKPMINFFQQYLSYNFQVDRTKCSYDEKNIPIQIDKVYKKEKNV